MTESMALISQLLSGPYGAPIHSKTLSEVRREDDEPRLS